LGTVPNSLARRSFEAAAHDPDAGKIFRWRFAACAFPVNVSAPAEAADEAVIFPDGEIRIRRLVCRHEDSGLMGRAPS
jgi:hypothetical protein